jgi:nucleotide-binding universal stress UspA family protein
MDRALAVAGTSKAAKSVVREAGELAAGVDAELFVIHVTTEDEYDEQRVELEDIPDEEVSYGVGQARQGAENFASDVAGEVLEGVDVEWEAIGAVGDRVEAILEEARINDCDHVFVSGRKRSPTGKALFGDDTQKIILNYDGHVTVMTE